MAALVRKASFGRKPHIGMSGAKVRALPTLALPTNAPHPTDCPVQFDFTISNVDVELDSAVHSDQIVLVWRRGSKAVSSQLATVVEVLDHSSGALSRTARLLPDLSMLCTLFSARAGGKSELKPSELELQEGSGSTICSVPLELSQHATGAAGRAAGAAGASSEGGHGAGQLSGPGTALVLAMPNGLGTLRFTLTVRRLAGANEGGSSSASSRRSDTSSQANPNPNPSPNRKPNPHPHPNPDPHQAADGDRSLRACQAPSCGGAGPSAGLDAEHATEAVEQRWRQMQLMEQAREDAATIKGLQADLEALIRDNKRFKEELLTHRKRAVLDGGASSRRDLVEQLASVQAELACAKLAAKKEAAAVEERQADAFNEVIRQMADDLQQVTRQRDEAWARLATLDKSFSRTARGPPAALAAAQPSTNLTRSSSFGRTISRFRTGRVDPTGGGAACREGG